MTEGVEDALDELRPGLSGLRTDTSVFRPATLIDDAIDNLTVTLIIAGLLLVLVVAAFLFQWRAVLIALVTVPVSLVAAALVLDLLGETFNAISFAGLAVALAIVIDDAVVSAENVARRAARSTRGGPPTARLPRSSCEASQRDAQPADLRDADRAPDDRARRRHGGPARRLLRAARTLLRAGGGGVHAGRPDAQPGAEPDALLARIARRRRVSACCGGWLRATWARYRDSSAGRGRRSSPPARLWSSASPCCPCWARR